MKKQFLSALLTMPIMISMIAQPCYADSEKSKITASYWTEDQQATIDSLTQIDEEGYLYEVDYTADYQFDELIKQGTYPYKDMINHFKELNLPESTAPLPKTMYGGCTAFATRNNEGHQIMGRNYDWNKDSEISLVLHTAPEDGYASVGMVDMGFLGLAAGFTTADQTELILYSPILINDGINEKGLSCTVLILDENAAHQDSGKQALLSSVVVRMMLDKTATVKEAEDLLKQYDIFSCFYKKDSTNPDSGSSFHWLVSDAAGDAAVFEIVNGELVVSRNPVIVDYDFESSVDAISTEDLNKAVKILYPDEEKPYQLVTNFYVTEGAENTVAEGYWRYQKLRDLLEQNPNPTNKQAMSFLEATKYFENDIDMSFKLAAEGKDAHSDENWKWLTVWSEVYDSEDLTMTVCSRENYEKEYVFNIK